MPVYLASLDGHDDIPLDRALVMVGRPSRCDVWIDSLRISRIHCCLVPDLDEVQVLDMGSTNGTRINGRRIILGILRPGDELAIAHRRYQLKIPPPDQAAPGA